jgi:quercetin dioxygenase-like cupin family protein
MAVRRWNDAVDGPFSESALRQRLESSGFLMARRTYAPGTMLPDEVHETERVAAVVSGRLRLVVAGHLALLGPGEWIGIGRGVRHTATVLGNEPVVALEGVRVAGGG